MTSKADKATESAVEEQDEPKSDCVHQWKIDPPNGPTSQGTCKICSEKRDFHNSLEISYWDNQKKRSPWARSNRIAKSPKNTGKTS